MPSYCAVRTATTTYVRYETGEEELYLLASDPFQLINRASDAAQQSLMTAMRARVRVLCSPPPPDYVFPRLP